MRRAFWQGYSKRVMREFWYSISEEERFVKSVFGGIIERFKERSLAAISQLLFLFLLTFTAGSEYMVKALVSKIKRT